MAENRKSKIAQGRGKRGVFTRAAFPFRPSRHSRTHNQKNSRSAIAST